MMQSFTERIQLDKDERILLVVRKHWFILLREVVVPIFLFVIPVGVYLFVGNMRLLTLLATLPVSHPLHLGPIALFFISLWGLVIWMMLFLIWTDYYLDMWTLTDRRIITIDQRGLFRRAVASFRYERLQDINVEINGLIATFLDFGELHAQTAGHDTDFKIAGIPHPREVKALILRSADNLPPHVKPQPRFTT